MKKQISSKVTSLIFGILVICFAIAFYTFAVWQEPTEPQPGGNVPAPLNTGRFYQIKIGGLLIAAGEVETGLIVANGNVGIGTMSPGAPLTIKADNTTMALQLIDRDTNEVASISWFSTGLTEEARINNYQSNLRFFTGSPIAESMRITAGGNVGIGTMTPSVGQETLKLDVEGSVGATKYCDQDGNNCTTAGGLGGGFGNLEAKTAGVKYQAATDGFVIYQTNAWARVYASSSFDIDTIGDHLDDSNIRGMNGNYDVVIAPIKKNEWWIATPQGTVYGLYWMPIGN